MCVYVTLQHSLPYSSTDLTKVLYNFTFVLLLYCLDFQIGLNLWNDVLALANLFLMSFCVESSVLTTDPRYTNLSSCCFSLPSISSLFKDVVLNLISSDFGVLR